MGFSIFAIGFNAFRAVDRQGSRTNRYQLGCRIDRRLRRRLRKPFFFRDRAGGVFCLEPRRGVRNPARILPRTAPTATGRIVVQVPQRLLDTASRARHDRGSSLTAEVFLEVANHRHYSAQEKSRSQQWMPREKPPAKRQPTAVQAAGLSHIARMGNPGERERDSGMIPNAVPG